MYNCTQTTMPLPRATLRGVQSLGLCHVTWRAVRNVSAYIYERAWADAAHGSGCLGPLHELSSLNRMLRGARSGWRDALRLMLTHLFPECDVDLLTSTDAGGVETLDGVSIVWGVSVSSPAAAVRSGKAVQGEAPVSSCGEE